MWPLNGELETCNAECSECGREFACEGTWDVEHHDGYGTRREWFPDDEAICDDCKGEGACEGTFRYVDGGKPNQIERIPCNSSGKTRFCIEADGSRSHLGVYCDICAAWYDE